MSVLLDGTGVGTSKCNCTDRCSMPCWQRVGITDMTCCKDCAPLPPVGDDGDD